MWEPKNPIRKLLRKIAGYDIVKVSNPQIYCQDGLCSYHNHDFMKNPRFISAYQRGIQACNADYLIHWRVHVALWVASQATNLDGDFVECGVNKGFLSSAIMAYLDWNSLNKHFWLFDTFAGLDERYVNEEEKQRGRLEFSKKAYSECYEEVKDNFSEFKNVHLIRGSVPDTLGNVSISKVCYLSLDMNCAAPEIAATSFFWDKLVSGGVVLLDDYAYSGYEEQNKAFNKFALEKGIEILSLPTGQGLFIKS